MEARGRKSCLIMLDIWWSNFRLRSKYSCSQHISLSHAIQNFSS
jgi:hypothetical protein